MNAEKIDLGNPENNIKQIIEELMIEYGSELTFLAYSYVKNAEEAKDIVQNVFVAAFQHLSEFRGDSSIKTWLYRVTINKCKDHLKSSLFKRVVLFGSTPETNKKEAPIDENYLDKEASNTIKKAVFTLKLKYREVILMRYYQDLSIKEISLILNLPEPTVHTRLRRAKEQLAPILEKEVLTYE
ncbi:sigma-70 family RNA polymerase sigma factor [Cytobacillus sp. BC1816]|uniref:sigma-70 family RNA polymerase sigma factor n=1 Tax=Cytobacillus sp. BC1816 TaxID=3440154 RepID=UPI003F514477